MSVDADVTIRPLVDDELSAAVDLVGAMLPEIPLYSWILGEYLGEPAMVDWLASVFIGPHVARGRVEGAFDSDGALLGIVAWSAPDGPPPELPASVVASSTALLPRRQDIVERLKMLAEATAQHQIPGDHVLIVLGVVAPTARRTGIPAALGQAPRAAAQAAGMDLLMTTSDLALGNAHERTHGAVFQSSYPVGECTVYQYLAPA
ncbi:hypothetical protein JVX90_07250 [Gordonia sp. PDNC005]|uniref:hypothetical protein n=1 Tax=unclassified Gordonia (in: high G+C Gram-positive bacteria) TaxID=2657482 RepID=UPI001962597D|nr:hypothetical protein [Gordonia sp. PDNC005]QRY63978.1 hypothetical protein JVX90_07250 [Gordonia sp. PDNC005]